MSFLPISQNLNMGGTESGAVTGPPVGKWLMLLRIGRIVPLLIALRDALWRA